MERPGILVDHRIVDLAESLARSQVAIVPASMVAFLAQPDWRHLLDIVARSDRETGTPVDAVRLGPPIPRPGNVFVVGANTYSHVREAEQYTKGMPPLRPMVLAKATSSVTGPYDPIVHPPSTRKLDYEVELGVVIGRRTRSVEAREALDAVAGYVVVNDVSARDVQLAEGEVNDFYRAHYLGKSYDTFCPTGPWMVTADEIGDVADLSLRTWVNDELRQDGSTAELCFGVAQIIAHLSTITTLEPGDLICTGSPAGVGAFRPAGAYLSPGDVVRCEVGRIGQLVNPVVAAA